MGNTNGWPLGPLWLTQWGLGPWGNDPSGDTFVAIVPGVQMRTLLRYRQKNSTQDINERLRDTLKKGIYKGGDIKLIPNQLAVKIGKGVYKGEDGMVAREDDIEVIVPLRANLSQRICARVKYVPMNTPIARFQVMSETAYQSDPDKDSLITLVNVNVPNGATEILGSYLDYSNRDTCDPPQRLSWRAPVANYAALPVPPADNRPGDVRITSDTGQPYIWRSTALGWQLLDTLGQNNLADGRFSIPADIAENPWLEYGRSGSTQLAQAGYGKTARALPAFPPLSLIGSGDPDVGGAMAARTARKSGTILYVKGRNNVNAAAVEVDDLRIGLLPGVAGAINPVLVGASDVAAVLSAAVVVKGVKDGLDSYVYLKVGGNNVAVEIGDIRLWQISGHPERLGLKSFTAVVTGDLDVGDTATGYYLYSRSAPAAEAFYASGSIGLVAVTAGDANFRLSKVANSTYAKTKVTWRERYDRGALALSQQSGIANDGIDIDSAHPDNANKPSLAFFEGGVESGFLDRDSLFALLEGRKLRAAGGDTSSLARVEVSAIGALDVDITEGDIWVGGKRFTVGGNSVTVANNATTYLYVDVNGAIQQTASFATATGTYTACPLARVVASGGAVTSVKNMVRVLSAIDHGLPVTVGTKGMFPDLQEAVDWFVAYRAAGEEPPSSTIMILGRHQIGATVSLAGAHGLRITGAFSGARADNNAPPDNGIWWTFNDAAIDLAGVRDVIIDGLNFGFTSTAASVDSKVFKGSATNLRLRDVHTTRLSGNSPANKLRSFYFDEAGVLNSCIIDGCSADVTDNGIVADDMIGCAIVGCNLRQTKTSGAGNDYGGYGIRTISGCSDTVFAGNRIHPQYVAGAGNGDGFNIGIELGAPVRVSMSDNHVRARTYCLHVNGGSFFLAHGNILLVIGTVGGPLLAGIYTEGLDEFVLLGNQCDGGDYGIWVDATSTHGNISSNSCTNTAAEGITILGADARHGMCIGNRADSINDEPGWTPNTFTNGARGINSTT